MELFDYDVDIILSDKKITPRQNITGEVKINVHTALFLRHVYIEIIGEATCEWITNEERSVYMQKKYSGNEQFFYCRHTLAGNDGTEVIMEKKTYTYSFKCKLPGHLPASWTGNHGSIKYTATVGIQFDDDCPAKHHKEITIFPLRNLEFEPYLAIEAKKSIKRTFRFGFVKLGEVTVTVWLPLSGIAAGQELPLICTIENNSSVFFGGIIFLLTAIEVYRSKFPKYSIKSSRKDICRVARMVDILKGTQEFYCVLKTDSNTFPTAQYWRCSTCQLIYEVWVQVQGSIPNNSAYGYPNIDLPGIPVIIGTNPLFEWNINVINNQVFSTLSSVQEATESDVAPPENVAEEIFGGMDEEYDEATRKNLSKQIQSSHKSFETKTKIPINLTNVTSLF